MKRISVIIVTVNVREILRLSLENLKDIYENLEVIVCDNDSQDNTAEMVANDFAWIKLLKLPNNGLAYAQNEALKIATGDYILYLGPDGFPTKDTLNGLVEYFELHHDVGAATVKLLLRSGDQDMDAHRGLPTPWASLTHFLQLDKLFPKNKLFAQYFMTYEDLSKEHEIGACISHFLFVRKEAQEKIGLWDSDLYFLYGEDIDFCYRVKLAGYKLMYLPQFTAQHWKGVSIGIRDVSKDVASKVKLIMFRGKKIPQDEFKVYLHKLRADAMKNFYNKFLVHKYPFFVNWWVYGTIDILWGLRVIKQKYINSKNKA
jgi:GT2 family glycosyltransferase